MHREHLNPQLPRMLHAIGFDRNYVRGEGAYLYDDEGRDYLDMLAGFGVFALGRHHPVVRQAMHDVLDAGLADLTQFDAPVLAGPLAKALLAKAPHLDRVYFGNSGTEAVEAALKFARYYTGRSRVLYFDERLPRAHRGLAVGQRRRRTSARASARCCPARRCRGAISRRSSASCCAATSRGCSSNPCRARAWPSRRRGSWPTAHRLLKAYKALLIADEVQCGLGRTGELFAFQHDGVEPDLVAVAKALSGGYVPVGATLGRDEIFRKVYSSMDRVLVHDSTFGSNAQAMAAGLATMHVLEHEDVVENARVVGAELKRRLERARRRATRCCARSAAAG